MLTHEIKFLTSDVTLHLKNEDYNSYKYETKKKADQSVFDSAKRSYCERRGGYWRSPCPRQLKRLESQLKDRIVFSEFTNNSLNTVVFSSGAIAYLTVKLNSLDVTQVLFDRYCVGKLSSQIVTSVAVTRSHMLFVHVDRVATLVAFGKTDTTLPCRIADQEPQIQTIELGGYSRRTERKLSYYEHNNKTVVLIWSATTTEPAPWSPVLEDLANLHLYEFNGSKATLIVHHQLINETLLAELSQSPETIHTVEQIICPKNGASITWSWLNVARGGDGGGVASQMAAYACAPVRACARAGSRLLLACIDDSLHIAHQHAGITHTTKPGFMVTDVRWSGDLVVTADDNGRIQCYDQALSLLHQHSKCLDLTSCFNSSEQKKFQILSTRTSNNGIVKLVIFNTGPIALLRISYPRLLTAWVRVGKPANCVSLVRSLEWDDQGAACLAAAGAAVRGAGGGGGRAEGAAQETIGAYMAPLTPHTHNANRFKQPVYRLARKFFHHLLRRGRIEKGLSLAVDLEAWDLFVDARWAASRYKLQHLVDEASTLAAYYSQFEQQDSECSESCSRCSSHSSSGSDNESSTSSEPQLKPPPLPRLPPTQSTPRLPPTQSTPRLPPTQPTPRLLPTQSTRRLPPTQPTPRLATTQPTLLHLPQHETSTNSIRPNLHQYLERENTLWNNEIKHDTTLKPTWTDNILSTQLSTISEIPRKPYTVDIPETLHINYRNVFQSEFKNVPNTIYRYCRSNYLTSTNTNERSHEMERKPPEKNKVKFSDTVTVAVVAKEPSVVPAVEQELADSLPLSPPHKYLAAFEPHPNSSHHGGNSSHEANSSHIPPGTTLDYVEV